MRTSPHHLSIALLVSVLAASAAGQSPSATPVEPDQPLLAQFPVQLSQLPTVASIAPGSAGSLAPSSAQPLLDFKDSDVKFNLRDLMEVLRDRRHEGWVLAAYPDPKTRRPLIGAGFSLDLPAREHSQRDLLNPHPFLEPSSAELWQAVGLDPDRLQQILDQFHNQFGDEFPARTSRRYRVKVAMLTPQITDEEATLLLRVSAIQAIYNARAYCRNFDQLTGAQQMGLSQLVYQMGVNLDEFSEFLKLINSDSVNNDLGAGPSLRAAVTAGPDYSTPDYWNMVQHSLMQSQWARLYRTRAVAVIAMLDPRYSDDPIAAEQRISATLHPAVAHRRSGRRGKARELAASSSGRMRTIHPKASRSRTRRRV
jgi:hypothetical protein